MLAILMNNWSNINSPLHGQKCTKRMRNRDSGQNVLGKRDPTKSTNFPCRSTKKCADPDPIKFDQSFKFVLNGTVMSNCVISH